MDNHRYLTITGVKKFNGATLLEVIIASVIVILGMVSMLQLQHKSLVDARISYDVVAALLAVESMTEMIYANPAAALNKDYSHNTKNYQKEVMDCAIMPCSSMQLAHYDIFNWQESLSEQLINVEGEARPLTSDNKLWNVTIRWDADNSGSTGRECPNKSEEDLNCVSLDVVVN